MGRYFWLFAEWFFAECGGGACFQVVSRHFAIRAWASLPPGLDTSTKTKRRSQRHAALDANSRIMSLANQ